jgi:hypothetical protein
MVWEGWDEGLRAKVEIGVRDMVEIIPGALAASSSSSSSSSEAEAESSSSSSSPPLPSSSSGSESSYLFRVLGQYCENWILRVARDE